MSVRFYAPMSKAALEDRVGDFARAGGVCRWDGGKLRCGFGDATFIVIPDDEDSTRAQLLSPGSIGEASMWSRIDALLAGTTMTSGFVDPNDPAQFGMTRNDAIHEASHCPMCGTYAWTSEMQPVLDRGGCIWSWHHPSCHVVRKPGQGLIPDPNVHAWMRANGTNIMGDDGRFYTGAELTMPPAAARGLSALASVGLAALAGVALGGLIYVVVKPR